MGEERRRVGDERGDKEWKGTDEIESGNREKRDGE